MSNEEELIEGEPPTRPQEKGRHIDVHVYKNNEEEKYKKMVEALAEKEYDKHIQNLIETFPEHEEEIREKSPTEITNYELELWKNIGQNKPRKVSSGVVGLKQPKDDVVSEMFQREYDSPLDMIQDLKKLKLNRNLTPEQHRKILNAEDTLWKGLKDKPIRTTEIKEKSIYDGKNVFLVKCHVCYEEIPQRDFNVHLESHKDNPVKNMFDKMKEYRGK